MLTIGLEMIGHSLKNTRSSALDIFLIAGTSWFTSFIYSVVFIPFYRAAAIYFRHDLRFIN